MRGHFKLEAFITEKSDRATLNSDEIFLDFEEEKKIGDVEDYWQERCATLTVNIYTRTRTKFPRKAVSFYDLDKCEHCMGITNEVIRDKQEFPCQFLIKLSSCTVLKPAISVSY